MKKVIYPAKLSRSGVAVFLLTLFLSLFTLTLTRSAFAQTPQAPDPSPQPCAFPKEDKTLSENPILSDSGDAPITIAYPEFDFDTSKGITLKRDFDTQTFTFKIDFSKLQAIFAPTNSDYLEGKFQDQNHQSQNVANMDSKGINQFFGANEKLSPKILTDQLKINYIHYVTDTYPDPKQKGNSHIPEAANKITDIDGNNPKTVYDMYSQFGAPKPAGQEQDPNTWGKYWVKIPTAWSEFYKGFIDFKAAIGKKQADSLKNGDPYCFNAPFDKINIVLPEYFRTTQVSEQTNRLLLPLGTQRDPKHQFLAPNFDGNILAETITYCKDLLSKIPTGLGQVLGKAFKISLRFLDPIKPAYAEDAGVCIVKTSNPNGGQAPYCPLPVGEKDRVNGIKGMSVSCDSSPNDQFNLQKDNQNVVCTFTLPWPGPIFNDPTSTTIAPNNFNVEESPDCTKTGDNKYHCKLEIKIWPILNLPLTTEVWNNATYGGGPGKKNPGIYSNFIPNSAIGQSPLPADENGKLAQPGKTQGASSDTDPRIRNLGSVNCTQKFVRDLALKPIALQQSLGINQNCVSP